MKQFLKSKYTPKRKIEPVKPFLDILCEYLLMRPHIKQIHLYLNQIKKIKENNNIHKYVNNADVIKKVNLKNRLCGVKIIEVPVPVNYTRPKGYRLKGEGNEQT